MDTAATSDLDMSSLSKLAAICEKLDGIKSTLDRGTVVLEEQWGGISANLGDIKSTLAECMDKIRTQDKRLDAMSSVFW